MTKLIDSLDFYRSAHSRLGDNTQAETLQRAINRIKQLEAVIRHLHTEAQTKVTGLNEMGPYTDPSTERMRQEAVAAFQYRADFLNTYMED